VLDGLAEPLIRPFGLERFIPTGFTQRRQLQSAGQPSPPRVAAAME